MVSYPNLRWILRKAWLRIIESSAGEGERVQRACGRVVFE